MLSEMVLILDIVSKYGLGGMCIILLIVTIFLVRKIATNHLAHIAESIINVDDNVKKLTLEVQGMRQNCIAHGEKIAKLEGISGV